MENKDIASELDAAQDAFAAIDWAIWKAEEAGDVSALSELRSERERIIRRWDDLKALSR